MMHIMLILLFLNVLILKKMKQRITLEVVTMMILWKMKEIIGFMIYNFMIC